MRLPFFTLSVFLLSAPSLSVPAASTPEPSISIIVNFGDYRSAHAAATDEKNVNWLDGDLRDDTICTECFAATELQNYLEQISVPRRFPILDDDDLPDGDLIVLGNPDTNKVAERYRNPLGPMRYLEEEGTRIKTVKVDDRRILFLCGYQRAGTLYAVYDFLERLGVRWLGPGEINEEVPRLDLKELPDMRISEKPAFTTRGFWTWEDRGTPEFLLWMARNKMNFWCVEDSHKPLMKKLGLHLTSGGHQLQWRFLNPEHPYPYDYPDFPGDEDKPKDPYPLGEYHGDVNKDGVLSYSEVHPEWFGLQGGKRSFRIEYAFGDNFCTSNENAVAEFVKNIVQDFINGQWQWADSINFWMLDVGRWCTCENCRALGSNTDRNLLVVHRLRQEIQNAQDDRRLDRNVRVFFLAYADVIEPPTRPLPKDFDYENCIATFFPIQRCNYHTFDSSLFTELNQSIPKNYYGRAGDPGRHYRGQICIGEYYNVSAHKNLPIPFMRVMAHDIPYLYESGARHMHYMHVSVANWGTRCLTNYQFAKMLWNPGIPIERFYDDYFAKRYGPAGGEMRKFYATLHRGMANITLWKYNLARRLSSDDQDLFPTKHLQYEAHRFDTDDGPDVLETVAAIEKCRQQVEKVLEMKLSRRYRARLEEDEALFQYAENTVHLYNHLLCVHRALARGDEESARHEFQSASVYADRLIKDTKSTQFSSSHANAKNAFAASYVTGAYSRYLPRFSSSPEARIP